MENLFTDHAASFSGYDDISFIDQEASVYIWFYLLPFKNDPKSLSDEISSYFNKLMLVFQQIPQDKYFFIFTLDYPFYKPVQSGDFSLYQAITNFNIKIIQLAETHKNIKVIDISEFTGNYSPDKLIDWKFYFLSRMQINPKLAAEFKNWFNRQSDAIQSKRKKCIILDLDNTLWGGILGEDGITGIKLGGDYPGNAFLEFQKSLLELIKAGVILAICSKNNENDVLELWEKNPNMILKQEHFAASRINWNNKAVNVKEIATELNVGLDSIVFIDDNPSERELVKQFHPQVEIPDFPSQPYHLPVFITNLTDHYFRTYSLTEEDKVKTQQYRENAKRAVFQKGFSDFSEYLTSLEIELTLQKADAYTVPRISQMTQKTNQFNLTTKRYTETDILNFIENNCLIYSINVKDKFGDNGMTGLIILIPDKKSISVKIDSLLLSCRILGKGIEDAFVFTVLNLLKSDGYKTVEATFEPTLKNEQVRNFYDKLGFVNNDKNRASEGSKHYSIDLSRHDFKINSYYKIDMH
ncbi:MAG: HAD-IIIC family phosphatase [Bacteroidota bacterium]